MLQRARSGRESTCLHRKDTATGLSPGSGYQHNIYDIDHPIAINVETRFIIGRVWIMIWIWVDDIEVPAIGNGLNVCDIYNSRPVDIVTRGATGQGESLLHSRVGDAEATRSDYRSQIPPCQA